MDLRKLMYVVIIIICIASIAIGVYSQLTDTKTLSAKKNTIDNTLYEGKTQEILKKEFNDIFNDELHSNGYDTSNVEKNESNKEIVYTISYVEKKDKYNIDLYVPTVNIKGEVASKFNKTTQEVFANKANELISGATVNTIYTVDYTGYINGNIMSVIIKSTLKEGSSAQRIMVQTYNYNLKTGKEVSIDDAIEQRGISKNEVENKINIQVKEAIKEANEIQVAGYSVYKRDINNDMYKIDNTSTFYLGEDGNLYIIYAYGNNEFTGEMDIIVI